MAPDRVQPGVKVPERLWQQFRKDVSARRGGVRGHLSAEVENALREYINASEGGDTHDRLTEIEEAVTEIRAAVISGDDERETDTVSKRTEKRISQIISDIREEANRMDSDRVSEESVEAAIERHAGHTYKTLERYKSLLTNQRELFPHPTEPDLFFVDAGEFIRYCHESPDVRQEHVDEIQETYGKEWLREHVPDDLGTRDRGYQ